MYLFKLRFCILKSLHFSLEQQPIVFIIFSIVNSKESCYIYIFPFGYSDILTKHQTDMSFDVLALFIMQKRKIITKSVSSPLPL